VRIPAHPRRLLIGRDLKVHYAGSALGYVWSILDPLLMSAVYSVVLTKIFTRGVDYQPYVVFLLSGQRARRRRHAQVEPLPRQVSESADVAATRVGTLRNVRHGLKAFPFYRAFVAIEF
jgi:hypothetical protein